MRRKWEEGKGTKTAARALGVAAVAGALLAGAAALGAHDFWVVPEMFRVPEGWSVHAAGQTGMEFPHSTAAIGEERVAEATLVSAERRVPVRGYTKSGHSLMMEAEPPAAGQWWVAVALEARPIRLSGVQFNGYLAHDGVWDVLERRKAAGKTGEAIAGDTVSEEYTKFAKALVQVGESGPEAYARPVGHAVEFVPLTDPAELEAGDELAARLLWRGEPLAGHAVFAGREGAGEGPTAHARTDSDGVVRFPLFVPGKWYLKAIKMVESDDPEFDYESFWATLTLEVGPGEGGE